MMNYLLLGDSQALGMKPHLARWLAPASYAGGYQQVGIGTREMREHVAGLPRADVAIVVLGGNDTANAALEASITSLVRALPAPVVWVGPAVSTVPEIMERKSAVTELQRRLVPSLGARWLDGFAMTRDLLHAADGVHFGQVALETWAARIADEVRAHPPLVAHLFDALTPFAALLRAWSGST